MSYLAGQIIRALPSAEFNGFRSRINELYSDTRAGSLLAAAMQFGYGQGITLPEKQVGDLILAEDWDNLVRIINGVANFQQSVIGSVPSAINMGDVVEAISALDAAITTIRSNKLNIPAASTPESIQLTSQRTSAWSNVISHEFSVQFDSWDKMRHFFNTGGKVVLTGSRVGGTPTVYETNLTSLFSNMQSILVGALTTSASYGTGSGGIYNLNGNTLTTIFTATISTVTYAVKAKFNGSSGQANGILFTCEISESTSQVMSGTLTNNVLSRRAVHSFVSGPVPVYATTKEISGGAVDVPDIDVVEIDMAAIPSTFFERDFNEQYSLTVNNIASIDFDNNEPESITIDQQRFTIWETISPTVEVLRASTSKLVAKLYRNPTNKTSSTRAIVFETGDIQDDTSVIFSYNYSRQNADEVIGTKNITLVNNMFDWASSSRRYQHTDSTPQENNKYGSSVSINDDGIVSASGNIGENTVSIFEKQNNTWALSQTISPNTIVANGQFGCSIDMDSTGNTIVVGAKGAIVSGISSGSVFVFKKSGPTWSQSTILVPSTPQAGMEFGHSVAINSDGDTIVVGSPMWDDTNDDVGKFFVFKYNGVSWSLAHEIYNQVVEGLITNRRLGNSVCISGDFVAVGKPGASDGSTVTGGVEIYKIEGPSTLTLKQNIYGSTTYPNSEFGFSVDLCDFTRKLIVGAPNSRKQFVSQGEVFVYESNSWADGNTDYVSESGSPFITNTTISMTSLSPSPNANFGYCVSTGHDGRTIAVSSPNSPNAGPSYIGYVISDAINFPSETGAQNQSLLYPNSPTVVSRRVASITNNISGEEIVVPNLFLEKEIIAFHISTYSGDTNVYLEVYIEGNIPQELASVLRIDLDDTAYENDSSRLLSVTSTEFNELEFYNNQVTVLSTYNGVDVTINSYTRLQYIVPANSVFTGNGGIYDGTQTAYSIIVTEQVSGVVLDTEYTLDAIYKPTSTTNLLNLNEYGTWYSSGNISVGDNVIMSLNASLSHALYSLAALTITFSTPGHSIGLYDEVSITGTFQTTNTGGGPYRVATITFNREMDWNTTNTFQHLFSSSGVESLAPFLVYEDGGNITSTGIWYKPGETYSFTFRKSTSQTINPTQLTQGTTDGRVELIHNQYPVTEFIPQEASSTFGKSISLSKYNNDLIIGQPNTKTRETETLPSGSFTLVSAHLPVVDRPYVEEPVFRGMKTENSTAINGRYLSYGGSSGWQYVQEFLDSSSIGSISPQTLNSLDIVSFFFVIESDVFGNEYLSSVVMEIEDPEKNLIIDSITVTGNFDVLNSGQSYSGSIQLVPLTASSNLSADGVDGYSQNDVVINGIRSIRFYPSNYSSTSYNAPYALKGNNNVYDVLIGNYSIPTEIETVYNNTGKISIYGFTETQSQSVISGDETVAENYVNTMQNNADGSISILGTGSPTLEIYNGEAPTECYIANKKRTVIPHVNGELYVNKTDSTSYDWRYIPSGFLSGTDPKCTFKTVVNGIKTSHTISITNGSDPIVYYKMPEYAGYNIDSTGKSTTALFNGHINSQRGSKYTTSEIITLNGTQTTVPYNGIYTLNGQRFRVSGILDGFVKPVDVSITCAQILKNSVPDGIGVKNPTMDSSAGNSTPTYGNCTPKRDPLGGKITTIKTYYKSGATTPTLLLEICGMYNKDTLVSASIDSYVLDIQSSVFSYGYTNIANSKYDDVFSIWEWEIPVAQEFIVGQTRVMTATMDSMLSNMVAGQYLAKFVNTTEYVCTGTDLASKNIITTGHMSNINDQRLYASTFNGSFSMQSVPQNASGSITEFKNGTSFVLKYMPTTSDVVTQDFVSRVEITGMFGTGTDVTALTAVDFVPRTITLEVNPDINTSAKYDGSVYKFVSGTNSGEYMWVWSGKNGYKGDVFIPGRDYTVKIIEGTTSRKITAGSYILGPVATGGYFPVGKQPSVSTGFVNADAYAFMSQTTTGSMFPMLKNNRRMSVYTTHVDTNDYETTAATPQYRTHAVVIIEGNLEQTYFDKLNITGTFGDSANILSTARTMILNTTDTDVPSERNGDPYLLSFSTFYTTGYADLTYNSYANDDVLVSMWVWDLNLPIVSTEESAYSMMVTGNKYTLSFEKNEETMLDSVLNVPSPHRHLKIYVDNSTTATASTQHEFTITAGTEYVGQDLAVGYDLGAACGSITNQNVLNEHNDGNEIKSAFSVAASNKFVVVIDGDADNGSNSHASNLIEQIVITPLGGSFFSDNSTDPVTLTSALEYQILRTDSGTRKTFSVPAGKLLVTTKQYKVELQTTRTTVDISHKIKNNKNIENVISTKRIIGKR